MRSNHAWATRARNLVGRATWADGDAYDTQAHGLARMFADNFDRFADRVSPEVAGSGPRVG